jgi:hypothetical protein
VTGITMDTLGGRPGSYRASWARRLFVVFAVLVLVALSFAIGRATMGHTTRTTTTISQPAAQAAPPAAVQPQDDPALCHGPRHPC